MAACSVMLTFLAACSLVFADLDWGTVFILGVVAMVLGGRATVRLLRPALTLNPDMDGLSYRRGGRWSRRVRYSFVSPWFIGWRGDGLAAFGVFRGQLSKDEFRRLARCLRQSGSSLPE
ncbi:hypothetical protein [Wenzhouxiangella limi]|uniref:PH domain-containing protein n=1 Tax=Wenzhouxiangella limi TaxID=2707351 RepID=A0A845UY90_9GAMM|nr:hypothetical protein [Wenzhouxiangella limi]NDY94840.1 hypothetical protein [Wenzhouxiangella limi]